MEPSRHPPPPLSSSEVFNASPIGIAVENLDGQPLFVNPAFCAFLGFSEHELRNKHCVDFSPREDAERDWELFQQLKAGKIGYYQLDKRYYRKDGSLVWGRLNVALLKSLTVPLVVAMVEDITAQKLAEESLDQSNDALQKQKAILLANGELLKIFVKNVPVGVAMFDRDMRYLQVSDRWCADYNLDSSQILGRSHYDVFPDVPERWKQLHSRALNGETLRSDEDYWEHNGSRIWRRWELRPWTGLDGTPGGIIIFAEDITNRKLAEEELRASEERLRLAQQIGKIGTFERDVRTGVVKWTAEMEGLYGLPPGAFTGRMTAFVENVHPDDRGEVTRLVDKALATGEPTQGEWRVIWPDGSIHWISGRWQVLTDESGQPSRVLGVSADVTERRLMEQGLRESEEKFRSVFRDTGVCKVIVSPEGRFLAGNKAFCDLLGYSQDELLERTIESITVSEDWPAFSKKLREALTERRGFPWTEKRCLHKSGRIIRTESSTSLILSRDGNPLCFVGEVLDVTKRKEAEEALSSMTRKLVEAQEHERARIARELHDDINQRLALLSTQLEAYGQNPPDSEAGVNLLLSEIRERINGISTDVQSLSHQLHSSKLDYLGIVTATKSFCREFSASQNVKIDFNHDEIPNGVSHEVSLCVFRVLQEALHNAVKHSKVRHYEVRLSCLEDQLHLTVSDRGVGFDTDKALDQDGLGLTSMRERVRLVNGIITIESKPMAGTTIHVRVPVQAHDKLQKVAV